MVTPHLVNSYVNRIWNSNSMLISGTIVLGTCEEIQYTEDWRKAKTGIPIAHNTDKFICSPCRHITGHSYSYNFIFMPMSFNESRPSPRRLYNARYQTHRYASLGM